MWKMISGIFLGWTLGSNDSANIFGTGVAANVIRYGTAIWLISFFVVLGALAEGEKCFDSLGRLASLTPLDAFWVAFSAAITMFVLTYLALPCSTSQAIVGAILGASLLAGMPDFNRLYRIVLCWVLTPLSSLLIGMILYHLIGLLLMRSNLSPRGRSFFVFAGLVVAGCFGAYALGSNNVANVTGVYVGSGLITPFEGALVGSLSIALGVLTYSRKVMTTVGKKIAYLDEYAALIAELAAAITVEIFTQVGVPVSTSQAIVGGVVGVGLVKGAGTISRKTLVGIGIGWISTPLLAGSLSLIMLSFAGH
jgi:PiT family inorganic phosphate transporter